MSESEEHLYREVPSEVPEQPAYLPDPESRMDNIELKAIAELAYQYWEDRGWLWGSPEEDWVRAEHTIKTSRSSRLQLSNGKMSAHDGE